MCFFPKAGSFECLLRRVALPRDGRWIRRTLESHAGNGPCCLCSKVTETSFYTNSIFFVILLSSNPLPSPLLHNCRLWLQRPVGNGIRGDNIRPNHGFNPVQPQLVPGALQTQLLRKRVDPCRRLQQGVDTGTASALRYCVNQLILIVMTCRERSITRGSHLEVSHKHRVQAQ